MPQYAQYPLSGGDSQQQADATGVPTAGGERLVSQAHEQRITQQSKVSRHIAQAIATSDGPSSNVSSQPFK